MDRAVPVSLPDVAPSRRQRRWWQWGSSFLTISIILHVLLGVGAAYLIVQRITSRATTTFTAASAPSAPAAASREHKVKMQKKQQTMSAPAQMKRVTTTAPNTRVALPEMPAMPTLTNSLSPARMPGMSGSGAGLTMGGSTGGGNPGSGRSVSLFGLNGSGAGLEGTFYDYKMDQAYQPLKGVDTPMFQHIVHDVLPASGSWHPDKPYRHFTSPAKLHGRYFIFPAIQDNEAGASFQSPRSGPGSWLAVYRGAFTPPLSGSYRFVGFGDNVMIVKVGNRVVLDASDHGLTGAPREALGNIAFPGKDQTPLFAGPWLDLSAGEPKDIEIAVGDEGGIFCSGLFIQPRETPYAQGDRGIPKLPVFALGNLSDADRELLGKQLPPECLQGPVFKSMPSSSADSLFNH